MSMQPTYRPHLEPLESRDLLSGLQAYVTGGNLYVLGTAGADVITVTQSNNKIAVTGAQIAVGNAKVNTIDAPSIAKVIVYGYGGRNFLDLQTVKVDATLYGGGDNDIFRCGTGNDTVIGGGGFDWIYRPYNVNSPVVDGASPTDIHQGLDPLCQTDASLAEAAQQGHNFGSDIRYLGNNIYQVKLYGGLPTQNVFYNGWTTSTDLQESSNGEFWMVLMQRARLQALGISPTNQYTQAQWDALNKKLNGRLYSIGEALYNFTGNAVAYNTIQKATPQALQASLAHGDAIVAQSATGAYVSSDGVIGNHSYAVLAVYSDAGVWKVRLYNPWGMDRDNGSTMDTLDKSHPAANDGFITLTWQQFTKSANFMGYYTAKK